MKTVNYSDLSKKISEKNGLVGMLNILDKTITFITVCLYFSLLFVFIIKGVKEDILFFNELYKCILIPGVSFIVVSIYRKIVSSPRPYEVYGYTPVLEKDTKGKSFPSRHVFSIFLVAFTYGQYNIYIAIILVLLGLILGVIRVVGGVHFIKDVVAGIILAILCTGIGFGILCGVLGIGIIVF